MIKDQETYEEKAREAGAKVRKVIDAATGEVSEVTEYAEAKIQEKPIQATLIAAGVGLLIGLFLRRR